jgi:hypothetical protein
MPACTVTDCPLAANKPRCWRPLAPLQGCPLAANNNTTAAHLHCCRTALLWCKTNLQTPLLCTVVGLSSCNLKAHYSRLQTSYLLAPACTEFLPLCGRIRAALLLFNHPHTPPTKIANSLSQPWNLHRPFTT